MEGLKRVKKGWTGSSGLGGFPFAGNFGNGGVRI